MPQHYHNEFLFAQAYLEQLLQGKYDASALDALVQTIREWRRVQDRSNASALLTSYVGPVLDSLAFLRRDSPGPLAASELLPYPGAEKPVGICLVVDPQSDIDCTTKGSYWAEKLVRLMRSSQSPWGILTDGLIWRLFRADELSPYDTFLEVRLDDALNERDNDALRLFERFFTAEAYITDEDGRPKLEEYRLASIKATQDIEKHLKAHLDEVLKYICMGFVRGENKTVFSEDERKTIFGSSVYLLYRIVFVLYAESRGLLPASDPGYKPHSLESLVESAVEYHLRRAGNPQSTQLWQGLRDIFVWVDQGHRRTASEDFEITEYDGELFDAGQCPYLSERSLSNEFLGDALYHLTCIDDQKRKDKFRRIDYRDLSVRHLGSLYEAILEYNLYIADQPLVARSSGDKIQYLPQADVQLKEADRPNLIPAGGVYFGQSPLERKQSGSYYTPEDVVDYIVSNTVVEGLNGLWEEFKPQFDDLVRRVELAINDEEQGRMRVYADREVERFVREKVLTYRVLDPAMGSGHFLVNSLQKITGFIVHKLNESPWTNDSLETGSAVWRRRVVERCLYGVDINPLATELAKLSLWLSSASEGKPLSFLDHHLKTGNSLLGARVADLAALPGSKKGDGQLSVDSLVAQTIQSVLAEYGSIAASESDDIAEIEDKKKHSAHAERFLAGLKDVLDVWMSSLYGNPVLQIGYAKLLDSLGQVERVQDWGSLGADPVVSYAQTISAQRRFFHWDIEFPEIPGASGPRFDAVVANPPYVRAKPDEGVSALFRTAMSGDKYAWVLERIVSLVQGGGRAGAVVPLSLTFGRQFTELRHIVSESAKSLRLANFDNNPDQLFQSAGVRNGQRATIVLLQTDGNDLRRVLSTDLLRWTNEERRSLFGNLKYGDVTAISSRRSFPRLGSDVLLSFWQSLSEHHKRGADVCRSILSESQKDETAEFFLIMPRAANYFVSAFPERIARNKVLTLTFESKANRDLMGVLLNSNIFYWYWRVFGDGFVTNVDTVADFPVPELPYQQVASLADRLWCAMPSCRVEITKGIVVPNYNFNKRMDILLDIDDLILGTVAPHLELARDAFAQYKSNSFMRPLDLTALPANTEED